MAVAIQYQLRRGACLTCSVAPGNPAAAFYLRHHALSEQEGKDLPRKAMHEVLNGTCSACSSQEPLMSAPGQLQDDQRVSICCATEHDLAIIPSQAHKTCGNESDPSRLCTVNILPVKTPCKEQISHFHQLCSWQVACA